MAPPRRSPAPSRPSFRPRPIDTSKPLPIIKSSADLRHEDDVVVARALPTIASGVDPTEEQERHLKQALLASVYGDTTPADIPVPIFRSVEPPTVPTPFKNSENYVIFDRGDHDLLNDSIEYDADFVDDNFAIELNIDVGKLEAAMDALEKAQATHDPLIAFSGMKQTLHEALPSSSEALLRKIHSHWHTRRSDRGIPFLRLFQQPPNPKNTDPAVAFRPREKDSAVPRRMNTYDNYRKAVMLRAELARLSEILGNVVKREEAKAGLLNLQMLGQRVTATNGGPRIDAASKAVFTGENENVVPLAAGVVVPTRGLTLPDNIPVEVRKMARKTRRKPRPEKKAVPERHHPAGVDAYGFDELGNKFLKHMRYFAGGFMNYGVSPYDHRVFAAASERNTVRSLPREPDPVNYPHDVPFAKRESQECRLGFVVEDILSGAARKNAQEARFKRGHAERGRDGAELHPRKIRGIRVRGRVGRGGRIMLDRVTYERERGVRAASYPASVEMGGVYTGGLPLDRAEGIDEIGEMGRVNLLAGDEGLDDLAKRLIPTLDPLFRTGESWPKRRGGKDRGQRWAQKKGYDELRRLPAFAIRNEPAVEVDV